MIDTPSPGSKVAIEAGCTCAVIDNGHGRGYMGQVGIFVISGDCPLHGLGHGVETGLLPRRASPSTPDTLGDKK